jgi:hypothetical protein
MEIAGEPDLPEFIAPMTSKAAGHRLRRWECDCQDPPILLGTFDHGTHTLRVHKRHVEAHGMVSTICPGCGQIHHYVTNAKEAMRGRDSYRIEGTLSVRDLISGEEISAAVEFNDGVMRMQVRPRDDRLLRVSIPEAAVDQIVDALPWRVRDNL